MRKPFLALLLLINAFAVAANPAALDSWKPWLREQHTQIDCTRLATSIEQQRCVWPGKLELALNDNGGSFAQTFLVSGKSWVALPGDLAHWPQRVEVNGRIAAVLEREQQPMLLLEAGNYTVRGAFNWDQPPQHIAVPTTTGLIAVTRNDKPFAQMPDASGRLWLKSEQAAAASASDAVKVEVFRKIDDGIPREIHTVVRLSVAGKARELLLGRLLLPDMEPLSFSSPLPARIEDDGRLRVQARAGEWEIALRARLRGDINRFTMQRMDDAWPTQEIWSFAAHPELRRVKVGGAASVDPSQIDLPENFGNLPTYLIEPNTVLVLEQQARGDAAPNANALSLQKTVWIDFNGDGATVRDEIRGQMHQQWRLDTQPGVLLGRASVNGEPQLVTTLNKETSGVEIRDPNVNVDAVSRVDRLRHLSATGWQTDFDSAQLSLRLPPGWKLWHASGPDRVDGSWLAQWNLWNIFLALLIVGSVFRLLGARWAAVAAVAVALTFHEADSPVLYFIPLLIALALLQVLKIGRLQRFVERASYVFGVALVLVLLTFAVNQIRTAIYPQLETGMTQMNYGGADGAVMQEMSAPAAAMMSDDIAVTAQKREVSESYSARRRYEPNNNVQTGPGIPQWSWHSANLVWSGPVLADQPLQLYVTAPWLTRVLKFIDVIVCVLLAFAIARALWLQRSTLPRGDNSGGEGTAAAVNVAALLLLLGSAAMFAPHASAQEFPPKYLLDELEKRLLKQPECAPSCIAAESALVRISGDQLIVQLRVSAAIPIGFPLPTAGNWHLQSVTVDGAASNAVLREGDALLLALPAGAHTVTLSGAVRGDDVSVQFSVPPRDIQVSADQWDAFGINNRQLSANALQLQKRERSAARDSLQQPPAQPFVRVTRVLNLDLDWIVTTRVERIAPEQGAINLSIPLLPGEAIIGGNVEANNGKVAVSLGSQQPTLEWRSVLKPAKQLQLQAADNSPWVESWIVAPSPRWHVAGEGLTPIKAERGADWVWQPWPGEKLTVSAAQPAAVKGATTTVENAQLHLQPGKRGSDFTATLAITSSTGGDYRLQLPEPAQVKRIAVNGVDVSQARADDKIVLPLTPGQNQIDVQWQLTRGIGAITRTPALALDTAASNITLQLTLPQDRWPLWIAGPRLGPAMLYWGVLVVIAMVAVVLAQIVRRAQLSIPLGLTQWLLLGIGMSTIATVGSLPVVLWFFALEARRRYGLPQQRYRYNLVQVGLVLLTLIAAMNLLAVIPRSLLSAPDMQVVGNASWNYFYQWYQDRSAEQLPQALVFSVPLWIYRLAMLLWSMWLVFALLRWIKWGWQIFAAGDLWRSKPPVAETAPIPTSTQTPAE